MKTRKRKSMLSKLLALCFALTAVLSVSLTAFAGEAEGGLVGTDTGSFSVSLPESEQTTSVTVMAYQIITVNIDDASHQPENPMYTWVESVAAWLKDNTTYKAYIDEDDNSVTDAFEKADTATQKSFLEALAAAIKNNSIKLTATKTETSSGTEVQFSDMAMGEYLLIAQGANSVNIYQPTTAILVPEYNEGTQKWELGSAKIGVVQNSTAMKVFEPGIEKEVTDSDLTVAVGDTVNYKLKAEVPSYPENATAIKFEIGDKLSEGLDYNNNSVRVFMVENGVEVGVMQGNDTYSMASSTDLKGNTFIVQFKEEFIKDNAGKTVVVKYAATVNNKAFKEDALGNTAFIGFNNDPYNDDSYKTEEVDKEVFTYGIELKKVDKNGDFLTGAEFKLSKKASQNNIDLKFNGSNGVYTYNPEGLNTTLTVKGDGTLKLQGLDAGTYVLTETKAPDGYVLPNGTIEIIIKDGEIKEDADGVIDTTTNPDNVTSTGTAEIYVQAGDENKGITINGNVISFAVKNISSEDADFSLPRTGGIGTMIFTAAGIVIMGCAVVMIIVFVKKRKHMN